MCMSYHGDPCCMCVDPSKNVFCPPVIKFENRSSRIAVPYVVCKTSQSLQTFIQLISFHETHFTFHEINQILKSKLTRMQVSIDIESMNKLGIPDQKYYILVKTLIWRHAIQFLIRTLFTSQLKNSLRWIGQIEFRVMLTILAKNTQF